MDKNKKIIIAVVILIIAIGCVICLNVFGSGNEGTTPFNNNFMSGEFVGTVNVFNNSDTWACSYKDPIHHIDYNMSTCKNATFLVDLYKLQGMQFLQEKTYNHQVWSIYSAQGANQIGNETSNETLFVYMCVANKDNQSYVIYVIFNNNTKLDVDGSIYCEAFNNYVEPLLTSITLKHNNDAPYLYELLEIDEQTFNQEAHIISEVNKGNQTAIALLQGGQ